MPNGPFYLDWTPGSFQDPTYNPGNQVPMVTDWNFYVPKTLPAQPNAYFDNRVTPPSFYLANIQRQGYTTDELYPYPVAAPEDFYSPAQPVRYDVFNQLKSIRMSPAVSGEAPTQGIYTGTQDFSMTE